MSVISENKNPSVYGNNDIHEFYVDVDGLKAIEVSFPAGLFDEEPIISYTLTEPNNSPAASESVTKDRAQIKFDNNYTGGINLTAWKRKRNKRKNLLTINVVTKTVPDHLGNDQEVKIVSGDIDGVMLKDCKCIDDATNTVDQAKTKLKDHLTAKGIAWNAEA